MMTPKAPSYFHGWSPDDKWITVIADRGGSNYDIFRIPAAGGEEQRLTTSTGYDDGSEYSPDGKWIYFNSDRSGGWDIWRIPPDGAGPNDSKAQRVTSDEQEDWFPHVSPNGKKIVFLSFPPGTKDHNGKTDIQLRMMDAPGATIKPAKIETVTKFFGGQGTINVNSWSPDSKKFAYVVYEALP
jgi:Tol biopolymer transport system component